MVGLTRNLLRKESALLIVSRKKNERVRINHDIEIVVVEIRHDKVRLGIQAPKSVPVHREEIYQRIESQGGNRRYAHLFEGDKYLGPICCSNQAEAEKAVLRHLLAGAGWGTVTASDVQPNIDKKSLNG